MMVPCDSLMPVDMHICISSALVIDGWKRRGRRWIMVSYTSLPSMTERLEVGNSVEGVLFG